LRFNQIFISACYLIIRQRDRATHLLGELFGSMPLGRENRGNDDAV